MPENSLAVGDVVQLKSGGPRMTVSNIDKYGYSDDLSAAVDWFDDKGQPKNAVYPLMSLKKVEA